MKKLRKFGKHNSYYLEVDKIFNVEGRTIEETQFIEHCLDNKMYIDPECEENEDIILNTGQLIFLMTGLVREWDTFKEKSSNKLMTSPKQKPITKMEKIEYDDLNYIKLKDILTTNEILTSLEIDDPKKMKFIRDYLNDRLQVDIEKDDLIVFEPIDTSHVILLLYDIIKTFENESQEL